MELALEAQQHSRAPIQYYESKQRPQATRNLLQAIEAAKEKIGNAATLGLTAPRPYPALEAMGLRWIFQHSYWFAYTPAVPPIIVGIFHEKSNIPARISGPA